MEGIHTWKSPETKDLIFKLCAWRDLMARVHDESLRYVLSDHAIVSLAAKIPKNPEEILDFIEHTDLINGSPNIYPSLPPISCVVRSHIDEVCLLLQDHSADIGTIMERIQQKHLDPTGCCSVSIYNYALFSESSLKQNHSLFSWHSGGKSTAPVGRKGSRELFVEKFSCKSPVYHNYRIYANDGRLLCYCDRRKLDWYLRRDLAKVVEDDPPAIMLLFEPKGRPEDEDNEFYIQSKKNICVGCGEKNHYLRYRIIPSCYRMHFPEHLKSHRSHDIVLVCVDCHEVAHAAAEKHKKQIAADFGIPLFVEKIANSGETNAVMVRQHSKSGDESGVSPLQLRTAAMALLRHGSHMPSNRRDELMQVVKTYYGGREVKPEDLETALLVGMSPHERRRLEKKKGLISRKHKGTDTQGNIASSPVETSANETKLNTIEQSLRETLEDVHFGEADLEQMLSLTNGDISTDIQIDEKQSLPRDACASTDSNEMVTSSQNCMFGPVYSSKRASRLSLLGHGHHGKEVVERLLQEQGEDGILTFCQKWRQVFVEAVNPRFLPAGWDIMHSGRRAFGEYSVYNPAKKIQLNLMN
ncbi:hypothetical protein AXF42_Ash019692 [Apostasia shenzhenica]|uniref:HRDC domain-containing protein n=1 Tax=Apostasia shenzhenica TaxID=1088818 RepID=A0A2H9ZTT5_9ASPA|nr:hypothetical protein AXF42_Ash019692 [Apostasia shenzhenica]